MIVRSVDQMLYTPQNEIQERVMYKVIADVWNYSPFFKNFLLASFLFGSLLFFNDFMTSYE